jgi:hypothetical protein
VLGAIRNLRSRGHRVKTSVNGQPHFARFPSSPEGLHDKLLTVSLDVPVEQQCLTSEFDRANLVTRDILCLEPERPRSTRARFGRKYGRGDHATMRLSATVSPIEDYTNKYKGEQVEVALFGGEYQEGVLTAYCSFEDVPHVELNGHILIPLQNVASLHCSSRCDAPEPDWPPRGFIEDDTGDS